MIDQRAHVGFVVLKRAGECLRRNALAETTQIFAERAIDARIAHEAASVR